MKHPLSAFPKSNASWESHFIDGIHLHIEFKLAVLWDTFLFSFQRQTRLCNALAKRVISLYLRQSKSPATSKNESSLLASNQALNTSVK